MLTVDGVSLKQIHQSHLDGVVGFGIDQSQPYSERIGVFNSYLLCHLPVATTNSFSPEMRCYSDTLLHYVRDANISCDYIPGSTGMTKLTQQYKNIIIYPNPVQGDWLQVQLDTDHEKIIQIRIYSITGACLATRLNSDDAQHMRLHVADLPPDIYQLQISGNEGMIGRERFIKQ